MPATTSPSTLCPSKQLQAESLLMAPGLPGPEADRDLIDVTPDLYVSKAAFATPRP